MLTLYLPAKGQPRRRPSVAEVSRWLEALRGSQLIAPLSMDSERRLRVLLKSLEEGGPFGPELALSLSPGLGVSRLFDSDAQEQLLPAELSFEQLRLELAPSPTFLPLDDPSLEVSCLRCGDVVSAERFERALDALTLLPFEEVSVHCQSCDASRGFKELSYDREVAFASAWLTLEECGSARLNPVILKAWGDALGSPLNLIIDQRAPVLDWQGGAERTFAGLDQEEIAGGALSFFEQGIKPSRALRAHARSAERPGKRAQRGGKGQKGRAGSPRRGRGAGWDER